MTSDSQKQERRGARVYGGTQNSGSGNTTGHKNDVRTVDRSIEFKTTKARSYTLKLDDLRKAEVEAIMDGREAILAIDFTVDHPAVHRYVLVSEWDYLDMKETIATLYQELYGTPP